MNQKHKDLYASWRELVKLKESMGAKILELIAHPDCKPEHLTEALPPYKATVEMLRKHRPTMVEALKRYPVLSDSVKNTHL